jgi:3-(3-hydroxy-phenyl)propionate hydroxylase
MMDGRIFMDRFLIADVIMKADFPAERWLWFDPPFHRGQSGAAAQAERHDVWRIDFQLGWDADPEEEKKPENVHAAPEGDAGRGAPLRAGMGEHLHLPVPAHEGIPRRSRVLFVGDAAHQVSPFGARGANSGFQDTDDLIWKLKLVMDGMAPDALLDTYSADRTFAADENLMNSTRSTDFITPKSRVSKVFRNAVLNLAQDHAFARRLVNSGRLSVPSFLTKSALNTPDARRSLPATWCLARRWTTRRSSAPARTPGCWTSWATGSSCCCLSTTWGRWMPPSDRNFWHWSAMPSACSPWS